MKNKECNQKTIKSLNTAFSEGKKRINIFIFVLKIGQMCERDVFGEEEYLGIA